MLDRGENNTTPSLHDFHADGDSRCSAKIAVAQNCRILIREHREGDQYSLKTHFEFIRNN